jgi:hypothetical protein
MSDITPIDVIKALGTILGVLATLIGLVWLIISLFTSI